MSTTWEFGDGSEVVEDDDNVDHTFTAPGTYTVTAEPGGTVEVVAPAPPTIVSLGPYPMYLTSLQFELRGVPEPVAPTWEVPDAGITAPIGGAFVAVWAYEGTYPVTVKDGVDTVASDEFEVKASGPGHIISISPTSVPRDSGEQVFVLTGENLDQFVPGVSGAVEVCNGLDMYASPAYVIDSPTQVTVTHDPALPGMAPPVGGYLDIRMRHVGPDVYGNNVRVLLT